jgi:DNA-binding winged helix-turn-helix (wHTH) protein/serine/threonine protein kinase/tetratricopeptide (TPR) repeat protein
VDPIPAGDASQPGVGHIWRFADCELDERRRELRVMGTAVDIEAKPLEVLRQLLLHAGEVVTKNELLESVWPGLAVVDGSLATAVSKVRKLLDTDDVIVTVPRVGYKVAVPVHCRSAVPATAPVLPFLAGQTVPGRDQWRLVRRLDPSAANDVWLAEHPKTHETRVFKFATDELHLKGLKREVTVARLLRESLGDRADFVSVLEWNFDRPPYFIESEYSGRSLAEWAQDQGGPSAIPLDLRLKLFVDVASAVAAAHALDLLHKDLKPANILVASGADGSPQVKIADFGSAALLVPARLSALGITNLGFTQPSGNDAGILTGTLMYLAPEVLAGQSPTAISEVYALGVLLYQLAAGDFRKPLAPGWEADIADPLLRQDIADAACGDPQRRLKSVSALLERVTGLDRRHNERRDLEIRAERARAAEWRRLRAGAARRWLPVGGVALLAAVLTGVSLYRDRATAETSVRTVAVLPLQNTAADPSIEFLKVAFADEIATILSRARGVAVRPFATTSTYDTARLDVQAAGRAAAADTLVTGRIGKTKDQLYVTLEAVDVANNALLWRDTFEAPAQSMLAAHLQLALTVRGGLAPALGAAVNAPVSEPKVNEAYELYLRSSVIPYDAAPNAQATEMLERAVELDPTYAPAWHSLSRRYYVEAHFGSGETTMLDRSLAAGERAVALDPDNVEMAGALAANRIERGHLVSAAEAADDLLRRQADNATAQFIMSYVLRYAGLLKESGRHCDEALLIDSRPVNVALRSCAVVFFVRGDFPRALNYLNLDRETETGKAFRLDLLVRQGKMQEALALGVPDVPQWKAKYTMLLACARGAPRSEVTSLARDVQPAADSEENYLSAAHLSYCGETIAAAAMLKRAVDGNYCSYPAMESDPFFANLRARSEYGAIRAAGQACQERFLTARARGSQ